MSRITSPLRDRELTRMLADEPELLAIADAFVATQRGAMSAARRPRQRLGPVGGRAKLVSVAVVVAAAALALVPIGGASLGQRAVDGVTSLWGPPANGIEPANQPALGRAADDAQAIAGGAYYTEARVDAAADVVHLSLAGAPQSIIDQLNAKHPGIYVINNDAAHPLSELRTIQDGLLGPLQTASGTVYMVTSYPTSDGYLKVGIEGHDVQDAQSALDSMYGTGIIEVFGGAQRITFSGPYR